MENLPAHLQLEAVYPPVVSATFSAPLRTFYLFDRKKIRISADVAMAEVGRRTFTLSDKDLRFPKELTLQEFSPTSVRISVKAAPQAIPPNRG